MGNFLMFVLSTAGASLGIGMSVSPTAEPKTRCFLVGFGVAHALCAIRMSIVTKKSS